jgi:hypothetical protein
MVSRMASIAACGASTGNSSTIGSPDMREITKMSIDAPMILTTPCIRRRRT